MTAPTKKTAPRKAAPKPPPTPAEATEAEAADQPIDLTFRGQHFAIARDRLQSLHLLVAIRGGDFANVVNVAFDPVQQMQLLALVKFGEDPIEVGIEIMNAVADAAGWGNSEASG